MDLRPPFETELCAGEGGARYVLDCMPRVVGQGRFKPHLVVRTVGTREVLTDVELQAGPYADAADAAEVAYIEGRGWVRMFG